MKLISISLGSWLLGLLSILLTFSFFDGEALTTTDIKGAMIISLVKPALLFPLASAVVLNIPVFLIGILAIGRTLAPSEALAVTGTFLLMGTVFGLGFLWNYQDRAI